MKWILLFNSFGALGIAIISLFEGDFDAMAFSAFLGWIACWIRHVKIPDGIKESI